MRSKNPISVESNACIQPLQRGLRSRPRPPLHNSIPTRPSRLRRLLWMFTSGQ
jgi:hypothetical protein